MACFGHISPNYTVGELVGCASVAYAGTSGGAGRVVIVPDDMAVGELCTVARIHTDTGIVGHIHVYIQAAIGIQTCSIVVDNGGVEHLCIVVVVVNTVCPVSDDGTFVDLACPVDVDAVTVVVANDAVGQCAVG